MDLNFISCMSIWLGIPVPHSCMLQQSDQFASIDDWAVFLITDSVHT